MELRSPEMTSNVNLSMAVNGTVREMSVHDFQRTSMRFDAQERILKKFNVDCKSQFKGNEIIDLNPSSQKSRS
jgi:hypothetical protein